MSGFTFSPRANKPQSETERAAKTKANIQKKVTVSNPNAPPPKKRPRTPVPAIKVTPASTPSSDAPNCASVPQPKRQKVAPKEVPATPEQSVKPSPPPSPAVAEEQEAGPSSLKLESPITTLSAPFLSDGPSSSHFSHFTSTLSRSFASQRNHLSQQESLAQDMSQLFEQQSKENNLLRTLLTEFLARDQDRKVEMQDMIRVEVAAHSKTTIDPIRAEWGVAKKEIQSIKNSQVDTDKRVELLNTQLGSLSAGLLKLAKTHTDTSTAVDKANSELTQRVQDLTDATSAMGQQLVSLSESRAVKHQHSTIDHSHHVTAECNSSKAPLSSKRPKDDQSHRLEELLNSHTKGVKEIKATLARTCQNIDALQTRMDNMDHLYDSREKRLAAVLTNLSKEQE